jgi:cyclophilin family peptidyl-prolyl cis-trans isomerase
VGFGLSVAAPAVQAQPARRIAVVAAEQRGVLTAADLATIRAAARGSDPVAARMAVRALGRLARPTLIPDIIASLRSGSPEVRAEAANALGEAPQGAAISAALTALISRLGVETDSSVRAVVCESIGRLPYQEPALRTRAEQALLDAGRTNTAVPDRLGVAKGFEAMARLNRGGTLGRPALELVRSFTGIGSSRPVDSARDARVRRLAVGTLIAAGAIDREVIEVAAGDADPQVRRLAMGAVWNASDAIDGSVREGLVRKGLLDAAPMVQIEALRAAPVSLDANQLICPLALDAAADEDVQVALAAIDRLGGCSGFDEGAVALRRMVSDLSEANAPRGWHRSAHALVALTTIAPDRARALAGQFARSANWGLRLYAAKSADLLHDGAMLDQLSRDPHPLVAEQAGATPGPDRAPARGGDVLKADDLRRLAAPRARVTVRGAGTFDVALLTNEAPATVLGFTRLAESGYYNGTTLSVLPNNRIEAQKSGDSDRAVVRDETGTWPHVRGTIGLAGDSVGQDGEFFIDLVDNPQFDHQYTVFGQVLNGLDVIDRLLEGDVIDRIDILP